MGSAEAKGCDVSASVPFLKNLAVSRSREDGLLLRHGGPEIVPVMLLHRRVQDRDCGWVCMFTAPLFPWHMVPTQGVCRMQQATVPSQPGYGHSWLLANTPAFPSVTVRGL